MNRIRIILCVAAILSVIQVYAEESPKAAEQAVVYAGENARFTVLTPQLVRMEWSEDGVFEDRASLTFINRELPVPEYKVKKTSRQLTIRTNDLVLT